MTKSEIETGESISRKSGHVRSQEGGIATLFYPARALFLVLLAMICWLQFQEDGEVGAARGLFLALLILYPHALQLIRRMLGSRSGIDLFGVLMDAFIVGGALAAIGFPPIVTACSATVVLANGLGLSGPRHLAFAGIALALGVAICLPFTYGALGASDTPLGTAIAGSILILDFLLFASLAYLRALVLKRSRIKLRESALEAEQDREQAGRLLRSMIPDGVAAELETRGEVPAKRVEAALLWVRLRNLDELADGEDPAAFMSRLNHAYRAFDAILGRRGLVRIRSTGSGYLAASYPTSVPIEEAISEIFSASREVASFVADLEQARQIARKGGLAVSIALHRGIVTAGLIEADRFAFDLWGRALTDLEQLLCLAGEGDIVASDAFVGSLPAGNGFTLLENVTDLGGVHRLTHSEPSSDLVPE